MLTNAEFMRFIEFRNRLEFIGKGDMEITQKGMRQYNGTFMGLFGVDEKLIVISLYESEYSEKQVGKTMEYKYEFAPYNDKLWLKGRDETGTPVFISLKKM